MLVAKKSSISGDIYNRAADISRHYEQGAKAMLEWVDLFQTNIWVDEERTLENSDCDSTIDASDVATIVRE